MIQSPTPQFFHDPNFITFRSWVTALSLKEFFSTELWANDTVLFMDESSDAYEEEKLPIQGPVYFGNSASVAQLNVSLVETQSRKKVFSAQEWPAGRFLHLEFLKEGLYTLHYSPAFSQVNLRRKIRACTAVPSTHTVPHNFHPQFLQNRLRTPRSRSNFNCSSSLQDHQTHLSFNSPFPEYNGARGLRTPKK